jgi:hypothetical protein
MPRQNSLADVECQCDFLCPYDSVDDVWDVEKTLLIRLI